MDSDMGRVRGSEVMVYVRPVVPEGRAGRNKGWQGGGVTRMRVDWDNWMVGILVMGERMRSGVMMRRRRRLRGGLEMVVEMVVEMVLVMGYSGYRCGGVVNNR